MINLNRSVYNKLKQYEGHFRQAVYGMCYSGLTTQKLQELLDIVKPMGYNQMPNLSCNACRLKMLQTIGRQYFDYQNKLKAEMEAVRNKKQEKESEEQ